MKEGKFRVSRVITRTGDKGETGLADGTRLSKADPQIELLGVLDQLNATVGYLVSQNPGDDYRQFLATIQQTLFNLGAEIAAPGHIAVQGADVQLLEAECDRLNDTLPPLQEFVLPGGTPIGAWCHMCRTQTRASERCLVAVGQAIEVNPFSLAWLNRLSDYFFIMSRRINLAAFPNEPQWTGVKPKH